MTKTTLLIAALAGALGLTAVAADAHGKGRGGAERASFSELDADGNGEVTIAELQAHAAARFAARDTDGDGALSAAELLAARDAEASERAERRIERFIERADANENGTLELEEMSRGEDRMARMFDRLDADGSGGVSEAEMDAAKSDRRGGHGRKGDGTRDRG